MIKNLIFDVQLRGAVFEFVARILVRRDKHNNFIFQCSQFSSFDEIVDKYRLDCSKIGRLKDFLKKNKMRSDLIEFRLNNFKERLIEEILFYDVKTRKSNSKRKYFESCLSVHEYMKSLSRDYDCKTFVVSIMLFEDWRFSFNIHRYEETLLRVYNSITKKTLFFIKNGEKRYVIS